jgi:molybdopterin converting factor small subunit
VTSEARVTLELHGFLAQRLAALGTARGTRTLIHTPILTGDRLSALLDRLVHQHPQMGLLFDVEAHALPEHVEVVLNDRLLDLQGGLDAALEPGDVLTFLPAHAGG